jgi:Uncharacterized protein involved in copper resistance
MTRSVAVEIAVQDVAGARAAIAAGADRVELCHALGLGGLTPSPALTDRVLAVVDPEAVNVLVRPRGGGFVYTSEEIDLVSADIRWAVDRGAGGVVVGALTAAGDIDLHALRRWRDAAGGAMLTFHRAIDALAAPEDAVETLRDAGVDRVLSSGGAERSIDGIETLAAMAARSGPMQIMAGGGIEPHDVPALMVAGVDAVHLSARRRSGLDAPSGPGGGAPGHDVTDAQTVADAVRAASGAGGGGQRPVR